MPAGIAIPQNLAGQDKLPKGPSGPTAGIQQGQSLPIQSQRTAPFSTIFPLFKSPYRSYTGWLS